MLTEIEQNELYKALDTVIVLRVLERMTKRERHFVETFYSHRDLSSVIETCACDCENVSDVLSTFRLRYLALALIVIKYSDTVLHYF